MPRLFPHSTILLIMIVAFCGIASPSEAQTAQRCFDQPNAPDFNADIRYCIEGPIRQYWESNGGLLVFGYPITPQHQENVEGTWTGPVQWFERDRLEDHGAEGVLAGRLGARYLELQRHPWQSFPGVAGATNGCDYFAVTKHSLCEPFRSYWQTQGGLPRFGYPITQPFSEKIGTWSGTVQYFERRRMEHHTENANTNFEVLLGLLGSDVCAKECIVICPRVGPCQ